jgi:tRNA modification GTPase
MLDSPETIAAPITGSVSGAVSVVRISGPETERLLTQLLPEPRRCLSNPRFAVYTPVYDPEALSGGQTAPEVLDEALVVYFKAPSSYTGEDSAEISLHASPYLVRRFLSGLSGLGVRLARPGEFSERAFLNGKLDLSQVEAVCDLIAAESEAQTRLAREQLSGRLRDALQDLGRPLRETLAEMEAVLDFPEEDPEEDLEALAEAKWSEALAQCQQQITRLLSTYEAGKICREGARVVLAGAPNAGKSTMLNRLLGEQRAIVTAIPGTTRDSIEESLSLGGVLLKVTDTAGLRPEGEQCAIDEVERLGIERSLEKLEEAEIVLFLFDAGAEFPPQQELYLEVKRRARRVLGLLNKVDLLGEVPSLAALAADLGGVLPLSSLTGAGFPQLEEKLLGYLLGEHRGSSASVLVANERHAAALFQARAALEDALSALKSAPLEVVSMEIRRALYALQEIVGETAAEDILALIFSRFCIGK